MLLARGFDLVWTNWIKHIVTGGSLYIMVNGEENSYFKLGKGLRRRDPLSPFLFNLVGDGLYRMLKKAMDGGLVKGI